MPGVNTITTKDLTVIEDQLTRLNIACRTATTYANQFTNPALKSMASTVAQHHRQQYDAMFAYLNSCQ